MSNTSTPTKANTFVAGQTITAATVNQDFDQLFSGLADVGTANILDNAISTPKLIDLAVTLAKLEAAVQSRLEVPGMVKDFIGKVAPTGYVLASGRSIGNAASSATERANADTETLWCLIYNNTADAEAPVSGGRTGGGAAVDYASNKRIDLPDLRGRATYGWDYNNGGGLASRITATLNINGETNCKAGGNQSHTNTLAEMFQHTHVQDSHNHTQNSHDHTATDAGHTHLNSTGTPSGNTMATGGTTNVILAYEGNASGTGTASITVAGRTATNIGEVAVNQNAGSSAAYSVLSPAFILNKIIKL